MTMASRAFHVALLVAAAGAGVGVGRWSQPAPSPDETARRLERLETEFRSLRQGLERAPRPAPPAVAGLDMGVLREDLRRMLREELSVARTEAPPPPSEERPAPTPAPSPRNEEAFARASQIVEQGIGAGKWGERERGAFLSLRGLLTEQQDRELFRRLAVEINSQRLRVTTHGPPL